MVDVKIKDKYYDGVITKTKSLTKNTFELEIDVSGHGSKTMTWPNKDITFCGDKIPNKKCMKES